MTKNKEVLGRLALVGTTILWGSSFVLLKNTLDSISVLYLMAIRFLGAALLMGLIGFKDLKTINRNTLKGGVSMGIFLFSAYALQTYGLVHTTPAVNAFLTSTYCVAVPFLFWAFRGVRPDGYNVSAAFICLLGLAFVSLRGNMTVGLGELLTIACGVFFALHIIVTAIFTKSEGIMALTVLQFLTCGLLSLIFAVATEPSPARISAGTALSIAYLLIFCTAVCYFLQTYGQKYTHPSAASVLLALESVFGTLVSVLFYDEKLSLRLLMGFLLIFVSVLISETKLVFLKSVRDSLLSQVRGRGEKDET